MSTDLSTYSTKDYDPGANSLVRVLWYFTNALFFINPLNPVSSLKVGLLKLFGASCGVGVNIKPGVNIKYPWLLEIGDHCWIGENVWIDNLVKVRLGSSVCLSQGAMLLTGNHNYKKSTFDLITGEIILEDGVWIGARATVCPGVTCHSHAVLSVESVANNDLEAYGVYQGNSAVKIRARTVN